MFDIYNFYKKTYLEHMLLSFRFFFEIVVKHYCHMK